MIDVLSNYDMSSVIVSDVNLELMNMYSVVKHNPENLIDVLRYREKMYHPLTHEERKGVYYPTREMYNDCMMKGYDCPSLLMAAWFIFLNKTCFNGLYRVNMKGEFNAAIGKYREPGICEDSNVRKVSRLLQNTTLYHRDYKEALEDVDERTFIYLDPPYRPIDKGSDFTSYTRGRFNDDDQTELANMLHEIDDRGERFMLSNSDPMNYEDDRFFDELYSGFNIERVNAIRRVSGNNSGRGYVTELIVTNYTGYDTVDKQQTNMEDFK